PNNDLAMQDIRASLVRTQTNGIFTGATGSNVIVGTFDTGIDWSHPDFKHPDGTTRILYIWDLTTTGAPPGNVGGQVFDHGNECSTALINVGACSEHDVAAPDEQAIGALVGPGPIVVIPAGNGGSNPSAVTGNSPISYLHATRTLITGDTAQLGVIVPAYSAAAGSINDYMYFNMWY